MPYNFAYGVKDDYAGTDFGQNEDSDGNTVKGSYQVVLPDGRIQTVSEAFKCAPRMLTVVPLAIELQNLILML